MAPHESSSPPRPRQVVQIGVTGHRPNRLSPAIVVNLPRQCEQVLNAIAGLASSVHDPLLYSPQPPLLRIISPLAEGADRIAAQAGLSLGADLQCLLPFHADEYGRDFASDGSREEFYALLARASAVFEVDGSRNAETIAYERAGRLVIEHSDFLIAIWDGEAAAGRGGTTQMVEEALAQNVPVLWLHASQEKEPCILLIDEFGNRSQQPLENLRSLFSTQPGESRSGHKPQLNLSHVYFSEKQPHWDGGRFFTLFRDLVAKGRVRWRSLRIAPFKESAHAEWQAEIAGDDTLPSATQSYLLDKLCPHYAWADGLSTYYGGLLRSGSLAANLLSAFAVFFALAGPLVHSFGLKLNRAPSLIEFALIAAILLVTYRGRRRKWHERWLNYRQLAERLRQYFYLAPLGCALPAPRYLPHFGPDPERSWVDGMVRAVQRDLGLAPATVNREFVSSVGKLIDNVLLEQIKYHKVNRGNMAKLHQRMHLAGTVLFAVTLLACTVHVFIGGEAAWLLVLAAAPPAFGAAFYSVSNQGEFARSGDRSFAMWRQLESLEKSDLAKALASPGERFAELRNVAVKIAEVMISETIDWNVVFRYRPLNLPG